MICYISLLRTQSGLQGVQETWHYLINTIFQKKSFNLQFYCIHQLKNLYPLIAKQSIVDVGLS